MGYRRYAVYYRPSGDLGALGARWLGWDPATGGVPDPVEDLGVGAAWEALTVTPRKYGLHATVKPPFRLADGTDAEGLARAFAALCADLAPVPLGPLAVTRIGGFFALCPVEVPEALGPLAGEAVARLDAFRAPPGEAELARRRVGGLTVRQETLLTRWGYPYLMDEFRFHITLTGRVPSDRRVEVETVLKRGFAPVLQAPVLLETLTLMGEDDDGRFHDVQTLPLSGKS